MKNLTFGSVVVDSFFLLLPLFAGFFLSWSLSCCAVLSVLSSFAIASPGKRVLVAGCWLIIFLVTCGCCSVSLPHGVEERAGCLTLICLLYDIWLLFCVSFSWCRGLVSMCDYGIMVPGHTQLALCPECTFK